MDLIFKISEHSSDPGNNTPPFCCNNHVFQESDKYQVTLEAELEENKAIHFFVRTILVCSTHA
jgi:hypothetical protein